MTAVDDFTKRMFEIHEGSVKHIAALQGLNSNVSTLDRALTRIYTVGFEAVNAVIKAITMLVKRMQGLFITRFARDLQPPMPPILDAWNTEIEEAVAAGLEPLKLSIFWRRTPPTDAIAEAMRGLAEGPRKMSIPTYRGIAAIPSVPLVTPPPTQELMRTVNDYVGRISEIEYKFYEASHAKAIRVGIDYGGARRRATRGVFEAVRRGAKEAYVAEALAATPRRLDAAETIREISDRFVTPASVLSYPVTRARQYIVDVSKVDRIAQPVTKEISEVYDTRFLETISKVHEVSRFARGVSVQADKHIRPAKELSKASELVLTIPDMERGLQPIAEGGLKAYRAGLAGIGPSPMEVVAERAAEVPIEVIVKYTDHVKRIGLRSHDISRSVAGVRAIRPPPMETRLFSTFLDANKRDLDRVSQEVFEVYRAGAPVAWAPSIQEAARIVSDHIGRISSMALKEVETYRLGISRVPSVTEAMEAASNVPSISEFTKVPSLRLPVAEKAVGSKQVLLIPEIEMFSQLVAEKLAETYRHGVISRISPPVKAVANRVAKVSSFGTRARAPNRGFDLVEAGVKEPSMQVPSVAYPPSTLEIAGRGTPPAVAVSEMSQALHASDAILKEFMAKASRFGIIKAQQRYPAVGAMEAARSLSGAVPRMSGQFPRMMGEKYLEIARNPGIARALAVEQYFATGSRLEIVPKLSRDFNLMEGEVRDLSMAAPSVARPSLTPKAVNRVNIPVVAMPEMSRALAASSALSRNFTGYEVEMEKAIKSYVGMMLVTLPHVSVGKDNLERIPLEAPVNIPSVKLQEIVPILSSIQASTRVETPKATQRSRTVAQPRPITVNVESPRGEIDIRELRRKIIQILREEARRHGVF
jgi:hypothetical protein